jgi:hypothetical protein
MLLGFPLIEVEIGRVESSSSLSRLSPSFLPPTPPPLLFVLIGGGGGGRGGFDDQAVVSETL